MVKKKGLTARKTIGGSARRVKIVVASNKVTRKSCTPSVTPRAPSPSPMQVDEAEEVEVEVEVEVGADEEDDVDMFAALRESSYSDDVRFSFFFWRVSVAVIFTVVLVML